MSPRRPVVLVAALLSVYLVWGSTYLAMRWALEGLPPMLMVGIRYTSAGLVLGLALVARGARLPSAAQWLRAVPIGALFFVGGNGFVALAERGIGSGLAAIVVATLPLWVAIILASLGERPTRREVGGLLVGVAGVVVLFGEPELGGPSWNLLFIALAPLSWAIGSVASRRVAQPAGLMGAALNMLVGGLGALVLAVATGETIAEVPSRDAVLATLYLIVFGSLIGFTAYAWLLANTRPALATSYAFVNPVIAVALGVALGDERFGWQTALAMPLVVAAVALVVTGKAREARPAQVADRDADA